MAQWEFLDYITEGHQNPVLNWYGTLDDDVKAGFDVLVAALSETPDWDAVKKKKRKYKELFKQHAGLSQLMFKVDGKKFRPLGILRRQQRQFIFLGGCQKHTWFWTIPPKAFEEAMRLKGELEQGRGALNAHV